MLIKLYADISESLYSKEVSEYQNLKTEAEKIKNKKKKKKEKAPIENI